MHAVQFILTRLSEEAGEVAMEASSIVRLASKGIRFGMESTNQHHRTNAELLFDSYQALENELQDLRFFLLLLSRISPAFKKCSRDYSSRPTGYFFDTAEWKSSVLPRAKRLRASLRDSCRLNAIDSDAYHTLRRVVDELINEHNVAGVMS